MRKILWIILLAAAVSRNLPGSREPWSEADTRMLFQSLHDDNIQYLETNLERIPDLNVRDQDGNTIIHALVEPGQVQPSVPRPRVSHSVDSSGRSHTNIEWDPPLPRTLRKIQVIRGGVIYAFVNIVFKKRMSLIRLLTARGVPINAVNVRGETPLHLAVQYDSVIPQKSPVIDMRKRNEHDPVQHVRFLEFLIQLGADPNLADNKGRTPIFFAADEGLQTLIRHGAALEARDKEERTPFLIAAPATALTLLQLGANPHAVDAEGRNRWYNLFGADWEELGRRLIEKGVNINQRDRRGSTPLFPYSEISYLPQARFLIANGADCIAADEDSHTSLHLAIEQKNLELLRLLLENGARVNAQDRDGETALMKACRNRECAELLLHHGADAAIPDGNNRNVLHRLAIGLLKGDLEMFRFFISHGVPIDRKDREGLTPLAIASDNSNTAAMELLLKAGADPNAVHHSGFSLLDRAELKKDREVSELLRRHGARHRRTWADRNRVFLMYFSYAFGIFPLGILIFGLRKPALLLKSLRKAIAPAAIGLGLCLVAITVLTVVTGESDYGALFLIFAIPLLLVLLISLSGILTLAEHIAPAPGITLSLLCAAGCPALTAGVTMLISFGFSREAGMALYFFLQGGSMAATIITLAYALQKWLRVVQKKTMAQ